MTNYVDISRVISPDSAVYPGDTNIELKVIASMERLTSDGMDPCNITELGNFTTHLLTHVDVPKHFLPDGATLDDIELSRFSGRTLVVQVLGDVVTAVDVPEDLRPGINLLFKTRNSERADNVNLAEDHVYIDRSAALKITKLPVNLVGIDELSVDRFGDEEYPAHKLLLSAGILILEGIILREAETGEYELTALPLKIRHGDGSPVRAILRKVPLA